VVKVFPLVSGHVADVKVSLGDYVQKGQLLAVLRSSDMANYFNDYKSAQSELAIAKKNLEVTTDMRNSGLSTEKDYISAQSEYQKALAQFNKENEVLKIYGGNSQMSDAASSGYMIKSPISGFIVEKNVNTGMELRADDANNLFTISDLQEVWATANVYETDVSKIKVGSEAIITTLSYPDKKFTGKVERIANILNPETNAMTVKIRLPNAGYMLKPGMFANISILFPESKKMLEISSGSVLFDDNKSYVLLFRKRCDVNMQQVNIYKSFNDKTYINDDSLHEGDLAIARNALFVFTALKKL
jgi:cobalt-zinc-cadmium efflux system membrane fusion protein